VISLFIRDEVFDEWEEQSSLSAPTTSERQGSVPSGRCHVAPAGPARLDQQIARISRLLGQLEDPIRGITDLLSALLCKRAPRILLVFSAAMHPSRGEYWPEENGEDDPHADVDHGLPERMYRPLDPCLIWPLCVRQCENAG
jgi:hypothetical protein